MSKKSVKQTICAQYFRWVLYERKGTFYADGRSGNPVNVGRHSLDTKAQAQAIATLKELDLKKAVEFGMAQPSVLIAAGGDDHAAVSLEDGRKKYLAFVGRPSHMGVASAKTVKRYRAVFDKFIPFAREVGVESWSRVTELLLVSYGTWLDDEGYAPRTGRLELATLKQIMKWLVKQKLVAESASFSFKLPHQSGTSTYCYTHAEVTAMIEHCDSSGKKLKWLGRVITALAHTGFRISELASLKWDDLDDQFARIKLTDDSQRASREDRSSARTTKNHRDRIIPVHPKLKVLLSGIDHLADGRIFHGPQGGLIKPDTVRIALIREVLRPLALRFPAKKGKQGLINGRLHSFRHYFCSVAATSGVDENTLKSWLGHQDSAMIRIYFHAFEDRGADQMGTINFAGDATTLAAKPD